MKAYKILAFTLLPLFVSCSAEDETQVQEQTVPISFVLKNDVPVMVHPGEKVTYTFDIAYEKGLAEAFCRIGGTELEGAGKSFEGAPVKAEYGFEYVPTDAQAGSTIDFIVEAVGVDGLSRTTDIPLYVRATKADVEITIPDDAPSEFLIGSPLEFTVNITSGIDIKHVCLYRNDQLVEGSLADTFENPKEVAYTFFYEPTAMDVGAPAVFKFEVMDAKGNIVTQSYSVTFIKPVSTEINEYFNVVMGFQRCPDAGPYFASSTGQTFALKDGYENASVIDVVVYYSGNTSTQGLAITSATSSNSKTSGLYGGPATVVEFGGGDENDYVTNWVDPITTKFKLLNGSIKDENASELTVEAFAEIAGRQEIIDLWNNSASKENVTALMVQPNSIFVFKTSKDGYGLIKVISFDRGNTNKVTLDFKVVK